MRAALAIAALAVAVALPAASSELELAPSPALRCLSRTADAADLPDYPFLAWKDGLPGRVLVELIFTTRDRRPEVKVIESTGDASFVGAVEVHVRDYRLPCSEDVEFPVRVRQDYVFNPSGRSVQGGVPRDAADAQRRRLLDCVVNTSDEKTPDYPTRARRSGQEGRVLAQLRFGAPDQPPELKLLAPEVSKVFLPEVRRWASNYRMPCHTGGPITAERLFLFRMENGSRFGFRDITLQQFVGSIRGIGQQRVQFDLNSMACPFELRLNYRQPLAPNRVFQIGEALPARRSFIEWLATAELDLGEFAQASVFGDNALLRVPCTRIDLQPPVPPAPKEKTS